MNKVVLVYKRILLPNKERSIKSLVYLTNRNLHNEEIHNLYASPTIMMMIKEDAMGGVCSIHSRDEKCVHYLGRKT